MSLSLILLGLVGWTLGLLVVIVLARMARDQGRPVQHEPNRINPHSVNTLTRFGRG